MKPRVSPSLPTSSTEKKKVEASKLLKSTKTVAVEKVRLVAKKTMIQNEGNKSITTPQIKGSKTSNPVRSVQTKLAKNSSLQKLSTTVKPSQSIHASINQLPTKNTAVPIGTKNTISVKSTIPTDKPKIVASITTLKRQPVKAVYEPKPLVHISEKNVMNTIHNVTVLSPPRIRKEYPQEQIDVSVEPVAQRERTKTRTLEPDEIIILKSKPVVEDKSDVNFTIIKEPVAFEINFEMPSKSANIETVEIKKNQIEDVSTEDDYEEDFESYESDFESYSRSSPSSSSSHTSEPLSSQSDSDNPDDIASMHNIAAKQLLEGIIRKDDEEADSGTFELKVIEKQIDSIDDRDNQSEGQTDSGFG